MQQEAPEPKTPAITCCAKLCPGVFCIFLATPLLYAVAFFCGHYEKLLRSGKTRSQLFLIGVNGPLPIKRLQVGLLVRQSLKNRQVEDAAHRRRRAGEEAAGPP